MKDIFCRNRIENLDLLHLFSNDEKQIFPNPKDSNCLNQSSLLQYKYLKLMAREASKQIVRFPNQNENEEEQKGQSFSTDDPNIPQSANQAQGIICPLCYFRQIETLQNNNYSTTQIQKLEKVKNICEEYVSKIKIYLNQQRTNEKHESRKQQQIQQLEIILEKPEIQQSSSNFKEQKLNKKEEIRTCKCLELQKEEQIRTVKCQQLYQEQVKYKNLIEYQKQQVQKLKKEEERLKKKIRNRNEELRDLQNRREERREQMHLEQYEVLRVDPNATVHGIAFLRPNRRV